MHNRHIANIIKQDLKQKMVLLSGPRQCGKTTLAKNLAKKTRWKVAYYNWDIAKDRKQLLKNELDASSRLWILDEIHKYKKWKNWLKGLYDQYNTKHTIFVTGSARLGAYSRGGDSLQGRYFSHRLHPFTLGELLNSKAPNSDDAPLEFESHSKKAKQTLNDLMILGGFPEPFCSGSERQSKRWRLTHATLLIQEDVRSLEQIQDLATLEILHDRLPETVGSTLSINSLAQDLEVSFKTVKNWIGIFERLYAVFRVPPFGPAKVKALKKEQKLYFWDWSCVANESARFENLVALHLLRWVHWMEDVEGEKYDLRYFRSKAGHEIDFIILKKKKPYLAVEVKVNDRPLDKNIKYFLERIKVPYAFQISLQGTKDWSPQPINGCQIRVMPGAHFLENLV